MPSATRWQQQEQQRHTAVAAEAAPSQPTLHGGGRGVRLGRARLASPTGRRQQLQPQIILQRHHPLRQRRPLALHQPLVLSRQGGALDLISKRGASMQGWERGEAGSGMRGCGKGSSSCMRGCQYRWKCHCCSPTPLPCTLISQHTHAHIHTHPLAHTPAARQAARHASGARASPTLGWQCACRVGRRGEGAGARRVGRYS